MKPSAVVVLVILVFAVAAAQAAEVSRLLPVQGRLTQPNGQPQNGTFMIFFEIWDASSGGNMIWNEDHTSVQVNDGFFQLQLGSLTPLNISFDRDYWLQISIQKGAQPIETLSPRQQILPGAYALSLGGAASSTGSDATKSQVEIRSQDLSTLLFGTLSPAMEALIEFANNILTFKGTGGFQFHGTQAARVNDDPAGRELIHLGLDVFIPTAVTDNNVGSPGWSTSSSVSGSWVRMDLGAGDEKAYVRARMFLSSHNYAGRYDIQYSDNAADWSNAISGFVPTATGWNEVSWQNVGAHRYWRFLLTNAPGQSHTINEIQMYKAVAGNAVTIKDSGNVGLNIDDPRATLTVNGSFIRRIARSTGLGPNDGRDNGPITGRSLVFTKAHVDTAIRVLYSDNLRSYTPSGGRACRWEIRFNDATCPSGALVYDKYVSVSGENTHRHTTVVGYCENLPAGIHEISVWVRPVPGYNCDAYTGWAGSRWTIEAEEVY